MKPNQPENDGPLRQALRQWTVDTPLPPRFEEDVWRRIARAEARPKTTFWVRLVSLAQMALPPKVAYSYAAIVLLLGVVGGAWAAQRETNRLDTALGSRYVQSIDPYQKVALNR
jgi:hypothetical protein